MSPRWLISIENLAIYGALAQGDIGRHFPPSDPQWKGAASEIFLRHAAELARSMGYRLGNADVTLVCERPKIGPHAAAMQARLAEITGAVVAAGRLAALAALPHVGAVVALAGVGAVLAVLHHPDRGGGRVDRELQHHDAVS